MFSSLNSLNPLLYSILLYIYIKNNFSSGCDFVVFSYSILYFVVPFYFKCFFYIDLEWLCNVQRDRYKRFHASPVYSWILRLKAMYTGFFLIKRLYKELRLNTHAHTTVQCRYSFRIF